MTDPANTLTGSSSPYPPSPSAASSLRRRRRSLRRLSLLDAGVPSAATAGAPRLLGARLRPFPCGQDSPADIGENSGCSLATGKPVVGEEQNDTLRVLYLLRRVDTVGVYGSPPSSASSGRGSRAPVGLGSGGVSVCEGCTTASNGEDDM